jgi:hypothetical protein
LRKRLRKPLPGNEKDVVRKMMWAVFAVGVLLIAAPFAIGWPKEVDVGRKMIDAFQPIMEETSVDTTVEYYYDVSAPLGAVVPAMTGI